MLKLLLFLICFGDPTNGLGEIRSIHFPRVETPAMQLLFALLLAGGAAFAWWIYRREASYVPQQRKRLLAGLRIGTVAVILFIVSGAFLELTRAEDGKGSVLLLVDASQSMGIADRRTEAADIEAAVKVLGEGRKADAAKATRTDLVKAAFGNPSMDPLRSLAKRFSIEGYTFGKSASVTPLELQPFDAPDGALSKLGAPTEDATQLGAALLDAARRAKGRKLDAIVVVSDGGSNRGEDPVEAAKQIGAPVYTVGVGLPQAKDLEIPFIYCEDVVFKNDRFPLNVRIKQRGYTGRQTTLRIKRIDENKYEEVVKEETIEFDDQLERMHTVEILPDKEGVFTYAAELEPLPDEADLGNNRRAKSGVKVVDQKIRVLLVEDAPRYVTYRHLKAILEADKQRIALTTILRQGDPGSRKKVPQFPDSAKQLEQFDVIVLGDLPPDYIGSGEMKAIDEFVRKSGGGLIVVAGRNHMPSNYVGSTLGQMLPVEVDAIPAPSPTEDLGRSIKTGFRPVLTPDGERWPALRFSPDTAENELDWRTCDPFFWFYPTRKVKAGATVLLTHPDRQTGDGAKMPIIASQRYGKGQVLYIASEDLWRWRYHPGAAQHRRVWGQMVSSLAMSHLLGSSDKAQVETDRSEYAVGDRAQIIAHLLDDNYNPLSADSVTATVERELGRETVLLTARKDQPGVFSGEWVPSVEGRSRIVVESGNETADRTVSVVNPRIEFEDIGQRQELLQRIASVGGGAYLPLEHLPDLAKVLNAKETAASQRRAERTLWNAPGVMVLLTLLLGLEWFIRKRSDLL
jgi:hypothetical protein